jgi:hypothetical protein
MTFFTAEIQRTQSVLREASYKISDPLLFIDFLTINLSLVTLCLIINWNYYNFKMLHAIGSQNEVFGGFCSKIRIEKSHLKAAFLK